MPLGKCDWLWKAYVTFRHDDKIAMAEITNAEGEPIGPCDMGRRVVSVESLHSDECDEFECECEESWCRLRRCCCEMRLMLTKKKTGVAQERELQRCRDADTRQELQETERRRMIANECLAIIT